MKLMVCKGTGAQRISILHPNSPDTKVKRRRIGKREVEIAVTRAGLLLPPS
jgi:hypothetical protein